jgi:hypothetical protein
MEKYLFDHLPRCVAASFSDREGAVGAAPVEALPEFGIEAVSSPLDGQP